MPLGEGVISVTVQGAPEDELELDELDDVPPLDDELEDVVPPDDELLLDVVPPLEEELEDVVPPEEDELLEDELFSREEEPLEPLHPANNRAAAIKVA